MNALPGVAGQLNDAPPGEPLEVTADVES
jgi:hypothetical protein